MKSKIFKIFTTLEDGNIAYHVTTNHKNVDDNRIALAKKYNFNLNDLKYMEQVHSNNVSIISKDQNIYQSDALVTNLPNTPLLVMVADCIPILFYDEIDGVIGVAHAGRNGTYQEIVSNVCKIMTEQFGSYIGNIQVILGPSIQKCCYEVSSELANIAKTNFGPETVNGRFVDLQLINKKQLLKNGIHEENITISPICTRCSNENYFSYRKDPICGRFGGIIMLHPPQES